MGKRIDHLAKKINKFLTITLLQVYQFIIKFNFIENPEELKNYNSVGAGGTNS